jgi:pilus assembly protein CpaB
MALILAVGAGLFAALVVLFYIKARESTLLEQSALQDVVVATRDILANTAIDERVVELSKIPKKYVQPGAIATMADAVGRVASVPIPTGSQVSGTALQEGGREALAFEIPRGMRAVTIAISDVTGVAGLVRAGNFVDLVGIFEYGAPSGSVGGQITYSQERTETLTLAQNVQVVAVGRDFAGKQPPPRNAADTEKDAEAQAARDAAAEQAKVQNLTLLVSPAQVQEIVLAQHIGTLSVSLRSNLDAGQVVELPRLDPLTMLKVQTPVPLKPKTQPSWREYRGSQP